jgi:hypothetical protein
MTDALVMSHSPSPFPLRDAALRMIAATEYYKSAGHLPQWARAELDTWSEAPALAPATDGANASGR